MLWNPPPQTTQPTAVGAAESLACPLLKSDDQEEKGSHSLQSEGDDIQERRSSLIEAAVLLAELVKKGMRTICFCKVKILSVF